MEKVKVIFRRANNKEVIAFFPQLPANKYNITAYAHVGQHFESSYQFYLNTKKVCEEEYHDLLEELRGIYDDCELVVKKRLYYPDLLNAWNDNKKWMKERA